MRGSITGLPGKQACGFILGQDGCEVYFDSSALKGVEIAALSLGQWVEFELEYGSERLRAVSIRALPEAGRGEARQIPVSDYGVVKS